MEDVVKNEVGEVIRARTKKLGVLISRQSYTIAGEVRWSKRFYYAKMVNGQLARFPLSNVPSEAEHVANQIAAFLLDPTTTLAAARQRFNPRALLRASNFSTFGELFDFHRQHWKVLELGDKAGESYRHGMLIVLRSVDAFHHGREMESWSGMRRDSPAMVEKLRPWLETSLSVLSARMATDYQRLMVPADLEDEEEEITQKITCDTNLRSARALFSREAMKLYQRSESLMLPDISDFMSVSLFNAKKYFVLPPVSVIRTIFTAAPQLKASDLNAYRAFLICVQCGLRKSEAANMRMAWLQEEDAPVVNIHADGKFKPKHGHGRKVILDPWVGAELREVAMNEDRFLEGSDTERTENVFDRLNAWLRKCGVDSTKPTHELRKLWFSQKVKREGLLPAAQQGGHRDPKITSSFYANSQMPDNVLPFWKEPTLSALSKLQSA